MTLHLDPHSHFRPPTGPVVILVADGLGIAPDAPSNAVSLANTPTLDRLFASPYYLQLRAHGIAVGLPTDGDMGNSEVGHNTIGGGRVFAQGAKLVNQSLASGAAFNSEIWNKATHLGDEQTLHLLGLLSDGNVHSHYEHLFVLVNRAAKEGVRRARIHVLLDGRDVEPRSALNYIERTEEVLSTINQQYGADFRIASGGGRMHITMDRYEADWPMVARGYHCHTQGVGKVFTTARDAVLDHYENTEKDDQYIPAFVIAEDGQPIGKMQDGDALLLFNFRGDRAIEISRAYEDEEFKHFNRNEYGNHPALHYVGMLQYDGDAFIPKQYLVEPPAIDRTMGEYLCAEQIRSFAISETQKFGHVTFFWNGNRSGYIDQQLETYVEIPSDNIAFNEAPQMKAKEIVDATIELIESKQYQFGRINLANGDMVGHTGDLQAAIKAIEIVDSETERLLECLLENDGILIFTADHGNADIMYTEKNGVRSTKTSHTLSPVPFAIVDARSAVPYQMADIKDAGLANIAATTFNLMGFEAPADYQRSLIESLTP